MTEHEHMPQINRFPVAALPGTEKLSVTIGGKPHLMTHDEAWELAHNIATALDLMTTWRPA